MSDSPAVLEEVIDGVLHWRAFHDGIGKDVHSSFLTSSRVAIDPMADDGIVATLAEHGGVELVALTNRHHLRGAGALAEAFGCPVLAPASGMAEFEGRKGGPTITPYEWGEELASGVVAHEVGAICPDDGALHLAIGPGALVLADVVIAAEGGLAFVPDSLMDDPERVKSESLAALQRLLELDFEALLLAHGEPIASGGRRALERFIDEPAQASFG